MPLAPLDLYLEVTDAHGTRHRWDANQPAASRPRGFTFRTKLGEGFSDASLTLPRRIDVDYPDLELVNSVLVQGATGDVAYEGRIAAMPRELGDTHGISVQLAGWMSHTKDRKFSMVYVDRDVAGWGTASRARKYGLLTSNITINDAQRQDDEADGQAGVSTGWEGNWSAPFTPASEAWYDAGSGNVIGAVGYSWKRGAQVNHADTNWSWTIYSASDDKASAFGTVGELRAAGPTSLAVWTLPVAYRYLLLQLRYIATPAGVAGNRSAIEWHKLAVYGYHFVPLIAGESGEPAGVAASEVIKHIAAHWCPLLNTTGVQATTWAIPHLVFRDRTYPYDAFLEVNKYHQWHLGVWENRTLHFRPYDFTDYQWEIRTDDPGTRFNAQGPSTENLFNGITVTFQDIITGTRTVLTPDTHSELRDGSFTNPWNMHGIPHWDEFEISAPTLEASALQIGRMVLAERNRPKAPGTLTTVGYVRDRQGNQQPGWKVRAGDMISITNFPNDSPRLIHETGWDDETKTLTLSIDAPASAMDAVFDRIGTALAARGLG